MAQTPAYAAMLAFLQERLSALDPSIDVSVGSAADTQVFQPLLKRLGTDPLATDTESFVLARMNDLYPQYDVTSAGSQLRDMFVTPLSLILEPYRREAEYARLNKSLEDPSALSLDEVDGLLANVFATVDTGRFAYGSVRIFFAQQTVIGIDQSIRFLASSTGAVYLPQQARVYSPADMTRTGNQYYIDVPIQSMNPDSAANVPAGDVRTVQNLPLAVRVTNPDKIEGGLTALTGVEAVQAARESLTERSPVSQRGVNTLITENTTGVVSVETVGFGEEGMDRDVLTVTAPPPPPPRPGRAVHTTAAFYALPSLTASGESSVKLPFTNALRVTGFASLPDATQQAILATKYVRVLDPSGGFPSATLSRAREILSFARVSTDLVVIVKDFVVYPSGGFTATGGDTRIPSFNQDASQGGQFSLLGIDSDASVTWPIGAPLPFTDVFRGGSSFPSQAEFGRDYLVLATTEAAAPAYIPGEYASEADWKFPRMVRMFPIDAVPGPGRVRVARSDAHLLSQRFLPDAWSGSLSAGAAYSARQERIEVIACGGPSSSSTPSTAFDGVTVDSWGRNPGVTITASTTNVDASPLPCHVVLADAAPRKWADMGVRKGQWISLAALDGAGVPFDGSFFSHLPWHAWGRVTDVQGATLTVEGLDWTWAATQLYSTVTSHHLTIDAPSFRFFWTVVTAERALVDATGAAVMSYDELSFLPAHPIAVGLPASVAAAAPSNFRTSVYGEAPLRGFLRTGVPDTGRAYSSDNAVTSAWVRLADPVYQADPELDGPPIDLLSGVAVAQLGQSSGEVITSNEIDGTHTPASVRAQYAGIRLSTHVDVVVDSDDTTAPAVIVPQALPFAAGQTVAVDGFPLAADVSQAVLTNPLRHSGFLLPYPFRHAGAEFDGQLLQFLAGAQSDTPTVPQVTLSGLPGGIPFPRAYPGKVTVSSGAVHVGGALDAFIKTKTPATRTASSLAFEPNDLLDDARVVFSGNDGVVDPATAAAFFESASLFGYLSTLIAGDFSAASFPIPGDLVVELFDLDGLVVAPLRFRLLNTVQSTAPRVELAGRFTGSSKLTGVSFRVVREIDVSLDRPATVLQQGIDLVTMAGSVTVRVASGIRFFENPLYQGVYIDVGGLERAEKVRVLSRNGDVLTLATAMTLDAMAAPFRIFTTPSDAFSLPVVRVTDVTIGSTTAAYTVPPRRPVGLYASSVAGLSDETITHAEAGTLDVTDTSPLTLRNGSILFPSMGVAVYDVVVLPDLPSADRYFFVRSISDGGHSLVLDRALSTGAPTQVSRYTIGHPAVGIVSAMFLAQTGYTVTPDTVFTHTDILGVQTQFRPSPAEVAYPYAPVTTSDKVTLLADGSTVRLQSATLNFAALPAGPGSTVELLSRVLSSTVFSSDEAAALPNVGGKLLRLRVAGTSYAVPLPSTSPLKLVDVASAITRATAGAVTGAVMGSSTYYLTLACLQELEILVTSAPGVLAALRLAPGSNVLAGVFGTDFRVSALQRSDSVDTYTLSIDPASFPEGLVPADFTPFAGSAVFFRVKQPGSQSFFPRDMTAAGPLWVADIRVTSLTPLPRAVVALPNPLDVANDVTYGYELVVENNSFSFSTLERVLLRASPLLLPPGASDLRDAVGLLGAKASVSYEYAPEVSSAQMLLQQPATRNVTTSGLARHMFPAYPVLAVQYGGGASIPTVRAALTALFVRLYPNRPLDASDLLKCLQQAGAQNVQSPLQVGYLVIDRNRRQTLWLSYTSVSLPKGAHIMGDLDFVTVNGSN